MRRYVAWLTNATLGPTRSEDDLSSKKVAPLTPMSLSAVAPRQATPPRVTNAPNFVVAPNDAIDVIAYILSLRGRP